MVGLYKHSDEKIVIKRMAKLITLRHPCAMAVSSNDGAISSETRWQQVAYIDTI